MPEVQQPVETNDNLIEVPRFDLIRVLLKSRFTRIFALLLMTMGSTGCAELRLLKKGDCENYNARTYRKSDGTHGYSEILVYHPTDSIKDGHRCAIIPDCQDLDKEKKLPEPKDCVDWSQPCERQ